MISKNLSSPAHYTVDGPNVKFRVAIPKGTRVRVSFNHPDDGKPPAVSASFTFVQFAIWQLRLLLSGDKAT